jgi:hypothetical protein
MASLLSERMRLLVKRRAREPWIGGELCLSGEICRKEGEEIEVTVFWRA